MVSKVLSGTVNITGYTAYHDDIIADDTLFNIYADARLVLSGDDQFGSDTIAMEGQLNTVTFVNTDAVTQNSGDVRIAHSDDDTTTVRNVTGATWSLGHNTAIRGAWSSKFVNLGQIEQISGSSKINTNFYDRGGTIQVNGTLDFSTRTNSGFSGFDNRFIDDTIEGPGTIKLSGGFQIAGPVSQGGINRYEVLIGTSISTAAVELIDVRTVGNVTISSSTIDIARLNLGAGSVLALTNPTASVNLGGEIIGGGEIDINAADMTKDRKPPWASPGYRPDIDGLRAVSILAVVYFHA